MTVVARITDPPTAEGIKSAVVTALLKREPICLKIERLDPFGSESELVFKVRHVSAVARQLRVVGSTFDAARRTVCLTIDDGYEGECAVEYSIA